MRLQSLQLRHLRRIAEAELHLAPGLNLIQGPNGAGKTSLIEAVYLMGYGRSFRGRVRDGLVQSGEAALEVVVRWQQGQGRSRVAGLRHSGADWEARLDGEPAKGLTDLCAALAVTAFEPGSHELLSGGPEGRRRFLDWALFHVEPDFLPHWRRYQRALKQRNALLKSQPRPELLRPWDEELVVSGMWLTQRRSDYLDALLPTLQQHHEALLGELGAADLRFLPGWRADQLSLADALLLAEERDRALGYSTVGPHRCDWRLGHAARPQGEALSRGQEKLAALSCVLAQSQHFASLSGEWPVVCLDDVASELDAEHQERVIQALKPHQPQLLVTSLHGPDQWLASFSDAKRFHVEHGQVSEG